MVRFTAAKITRAQLDHVYDEGQRYAETFIQSYQNGSSPVGNGMVGNVCEPSDENCARTKGNKMRLATY